MSKSKTRPENADDDEFPADDQNNKEQSSSALEARIQELETQLKEKEQKYLYLYSEFETFKKRAAKEREDLKKFGWESSARSLLEVIDNLERALAHTPKANDSGYKLLVDGIKMVLNQFKAVLENQGVQALKTEHQMFDPYLHEAISQESSDQPKGQILREESKGYTLHGRLLRPARVVFSSGPPS